MENQKIEYIDPGVDEHLEDPEYHVDNAPFYEYWKAVQASEVRNLV